MADSLNSNNISYEGFLDGYHILGYDLTTSGDAGGTPFVNPNVRVGDLRVKIDFDKVIPPELDLQLIIFAEFNSMIQLNKDGSLTSSFSTL